MGQKQHKGGNKNLLIEINPINHYYYDMYVYNYKNQTNYKNVISSSIVNDMLKIKNKAKLIEYIEENSEIAFKEINSLILSFTLNDRKYQLELYNMNQYINIIYLLLRIDYLFLSLIFFSLLSAFQSSKSSLYYNLRQLHFIVVCINTCYYGYDRYYIIFESKYHKIGYKEHFFYMLFFLLPMLINEICVIGSLFVDTGKIENLCLLTSLVLEGSIIYFWVQEQFEKNTFKQIKSYYYELQNKIIKKIKKNK